MEIQCSIEMIFRNPEQLLQAEDASEGAFLSLNQPGL